MDIQLLDDRILVEPEPIDTTTVGGLALPENAQLHASKLRVGKVLGTGPGRADLEVAMRVKEGDRVLHHVHAGEMVFLEGKTLLIMGDRDVAAILGAETQVQPFKIKV